MHGSAVGTATPKQPKNSGIQRFNVEKMFLWRLWRLVFPMLFFVKGTVPSRGWDCRGSMVGADRLNVPAIDTFSH